MTEHWLCWSDPSLWGWSTDWSAQSDPSCIKSSDDNDGGLNDGEGMGDGDEIMISTNKGRVIRIAVKEIRTAGRNTQGVRIIKLSGDEKVVSAIKIEDNLI